MITVRLDSRVSGRCWICDEQIKDSPGAIVDVPGLAVGVTIFKMVCMSCVAELGCAFAENADHAPRSSRVDPIPAHQRALLTKPPPPEPRRSGGGK